jgi:hypothetical protein
VGVVHEKKQVNDTERESNYQKEIYERQKVGKRVAPIEVRKKAKQ